MGYYTGNVCRIYLKNFIVYDEVEIKPIPNLNILFGPNGSGKSTFLCALCIGLGGKPSVTGRAKELGSYVKEGKTCAVIEVELFKENSQNVVIQCRFQTSGPISWFLNNNSCSKKAVEGVVQEMNIQMNNLCQFLPQDRVGGFAKMNKKELLENTEKLVGEDLAEEHKILKDGFKGLIEMQQKLTNTHKVMADRQDVISRLEGMVEAKAKKEKLDKEIETYERKYLWLLYMAKKEEENKLKGNVNNLQIKLNEALSQNRPLDAKIGRARDKIMKVKSEIYQQEQKLNSLCKLIAAHETDGAALKNRLSYAEDVYLKQVERLENQKKELLGYEKQLNVYQTTLQKLEDIQESVAMTQLAIINREIEDLSNKVVDIKSEKDELGFSLKTSERELQSLEAEELELRNIKKRRLDLLQHKNRDAYDAAMWLKTNAGRFQHKIYGPICCELNVKEPKFSKYVEDRIPFRDIVAFLFLSKQDMNAFKIAMDQQRKKVNLVFCNNTNLASFIPATPIDQLRHYGFEVYLSDTVGAPPEVLSYLCQMHKFHEIPISTNGSVRDDIPHNLSVYYIGDQRISTRKSRYDEMISTNISEIGQPFLLSLSVNIKKIDEIKQTKFATENIITQCKQKIQSFLDQEKEVVLAVEKVKTKKQELNDKLVLRKECVRKINAKKFQIESLKSELIDLKTAENEKKNNQQDIVIELCRVNEKNTQCVKKQFSFSCVLSKKKAELELLEALIEQFEYKKQEYVDSVAHIKVTIKEAESAYLAAKNQLKECLNNILGALNISSQMGLTKQVLREYNECMADIERLTEEISVLGRKIQCHSSRLESGKANWLPKVKKLAQDINNAVSSYLKVMHYAGKVELDYEKEEDFSTYGLRISVQFRPSEKMRELSAIHHSGGEKSVCTALYLMSLQNMTASPFRCLDEINQGMDSFNERKVLEALVNSVESSKNKTQYFFVTPKLLMNMPVSRKIEFISIINSVCSKQLNI